MPIYEYECTKCGKKIEEYQNIDDEPLVECEFCKGKLVLLLSVNSINVIYNSNEHEEKEIKPEVRKIIEKIKKGDENTAADIFGSPDNYVK